MTLLWSYGQTSSHQYSIITVQIGSPSSRHLQYVPDVLLLQALSINPDHSRSLIAKSEDVMQNPALIFKNIARVKCLVDHRQFTGPVVFTGDCTKVQLQLAYSNHFGGHDIGSTLPLDECEVRNSGNIDSFVQRAKAKKVIASQVQVIMAKVSNHVYMLESCYCAEQFLLCSFQSLMHLLLPLQYYQRLARIKCLRFISNTWISSEWQCSSI